MTTIARFQVPEEAHVFRAYLEAREIPAYLWDEHLVQLCWHYSDAIGGVRVVVNGSDAQPATEAYAEYAQALMEPPRRGSVVRLWPFVLVLSFFMGAPMLVFGRRDLASAEGSEITP